MTSDQTHDHTAQVLLRQRWYHRPMWRVGGIVVAIMMILCCGALVMIGVSGNSSDDTPSDVDQTSGQRADIRASNEPTTVKSPITRAKPAYILEVTGPGTADITFFTGRTSSTVNGVRLPWRKEVSSDENYTSVTAFVQKATAKRPVSCKISERTDDGEIKIISEGSSEPGDFVTISCDKLF